MKQQIKTWIEQKTQRRKEKVKEQARDTIIQTLLQDFSTEDSIEIKTKADKKFEEILNKRLEILTEEKKAIEGWLKSVL